MSRPRTGTTSTAGTRTTAGGSASRRAPGPPRAPHIRARKVLRDLWDDKSRTVLVVVSIVAGVFALSLTLRTQAILSREMPRQYAAVSPADVTLGVTPFDERLVETVRQVPGVKAAVGQGHYDLKVRVGGQWDPMILTTYGDFGRVDVGRPSPAGGSWPPAPGTVLLERSYTGAVGTGTGGRVRVQMPSGTMVEVPVSGLTHDLTVVSGRLGSPYVAAYATPQTAGRLRLPATFNTLQITLTHPLDHARTQALVADLRSRIGAGGHTVSGSQIWPHDTPPTQGIVDSVLNTLSALGVLSLLLSTLLVVNTISALIVRQMPQIGVLKAIGASRRDVVVLYLSGILVLAALALAVAVPLAFLASRALVTTIGALFDYDITSFGVPPYVYAAEILTGLVVPVLAGLYPVLTGSRVSVRETISGQQGATFGTSRIDRALGRLRALPLAQRYAARNLVRRKGRLVITLSALAFGGAIAVSVLSVRASLFATLDQVSRYWQQDVTVSLSRPSRTQPLVRTLAAVPGVASVASQPAELAVRRRPDGSSSQQPAAVFGVDPTSPLLRPTLVSGRWLTARDQGGVDVNLGLLKRESDVQVGSALTLVAGGRTTTWHVVGVVTNQLLNYNDSAPDQAIVYANLPAFGTATGSPGTTDRLVVTTIRHDAASQRQVADAVQQRLAQPGLQVVAQTRTGIQAQVSGLIGAIVVVLLVMVALFVIVAGLALMGTMSLNVLDRRKEIGVLRAIGSSSRQLIGIVLAEALYMGLLSWALAALAALPITKLLADVVGTTMLDAPLVFRFPAIAVLGWLAVVLLVAAAASYLPAAGAARLSVRDVLAYE